MRISAVVGTTSKLANCQCDRPPSPLPPRAVGHKEAQPAISSVALLLFGIRGTWCRQSLNFRVVTLTSSGAGTFTVRAVFSGRSANKRETLNELGPC